MLNYHLLVAVGLFEDIWLIKILKFMYNNVNHNKHKIMVILFARLNKLLILGIINLLIYINLKSIYSKIYGLKSKFCMHNHFLFLIALLIG